MPEVVEREITFELLERGEVPLTDRQRVWLGLPEHSDEVKLLVEGEWLACAWNSRRRRLHGEALHELLQDCGRDGWFLRLERRADDLTLTIVERAATTLRAVAAPAPSPGREPAPDSRAARRRRLREERYRLPSASEFRWYGKIGLHAPTLGTFKEQLVARGWDPSEVVDLRLEGERLAAAGDDGELLAVDVANVDRLGHQEAAAYAVLVRMRGRGILADEVGLGKTIEAGLIAKELLLRGRARRVLVLCPASLREQWRAEMAEKFGEDFTVVASQEPDLSGDRLVASLEWGRRNLGLFAEQHFDLVIVDEAHRLAGKGAARSRALAKQLARARYVLFLTATPVQNDLAELYRLVELLRPGTFQSEAQFTRRYVEGDNPRAPRRPEELRALLRDAVVRTTRTQAGLDLPPRTRVDVPVELGGTELELYRRCLGTLRERLSGPRDTSRRWHLAKLLTASPAALGKSARRMASKHPDPATARVLGELADLAEDVPTSAREAQALARVSEWVAEHGQVLVFTGHTDAIDRLLRQLHDQGIAAGAYHGGMSMGAKAAAVHAFREGGTRVLVSTDAGAEGQNLQFCNCVLNFDLPWNPMRLEQRIGRVHRVGQTKPVQVANLFTRHTVDEQVYWLLHEKLKMFELLFGQVTTVLGELDPGSAEASSFEGRVLAAVLSTSDRAMHAEFERLGQQLAKARERALSMIGNDQRISQWLATTRKEADELQPERRAQERQRQRQVERFARRFLDTFGATVERESRAFVSARLPEALHPDFERERLHLAFDRGALDEHPDAELCAVGSEAFDELVLALRLRGDLRASVAVPPAPGTQKAPHAATLRLVDRSVRHGPGWSARAVWKASGGDREEIVEVAVGDPPAGRFPRRRLDPGEPLPAALAAPPALLKRVRDATVPELRALASQLAEDHTSAVARERERLDGYFHTQIQERERARRGSFTAALRKQYEEESRQLRDDWEAQRAALRIDEEPRVRAHLLTLDLAGGEDFEVVETWEHASGRRREVTYPLAPSPAPAYRDEEGAPVRVLGMCAGGHLAEAERLRTCAGCQAERCPFCPGGGVRPCTLCEGDRCHGCERRGRCRACARLREATTADVAALPAELAATGLRVLLGHRGEQAVVVLLGSFRREVATVAGGNVVRWRTGAPEPPALLRARLGAALRSGDGDVAVRAGSPATPPEPEAAHLVLRAAERRELRWSVVDAAGRALAGTPAPAHPTVTGPLERAEEDLARVAEVAGFATVAIPEPAGPETASTLAALAGQSPRATRAALLVEPRLQGERLWLDAWGLHHAAFDGPHVVERDGDWLEETPAWAPEGWQPAPQVVRHAALDGFEVAVVRAGDHAMAAVRADGRTRWATLRERPDDLGRLLLASALGRDGTLPAVAAYFDPALVEGPALRGGRLVERRVRRVAIELPGSAPPEVDAAARDHLLAGRQPARPASDPALLPAELTADLLARADAWARPLPRPTLGVGLLVEEDWAVGDQRASLTYELAPGITRGWVRCQATGIPATELTLDREGHLVAKPLVCSYCHQDTCGLCQAGALPCEICRIEVCRPCAAPSQVRLCRACAALRPAGRLRRLRFQRLRRRGGRVLHGRDDHHAVAAVETVAGWRLLLRPPGGPWSRNPLPVSTWVDALTGDGPHTPAPPAP